MKNEDFTISIIIPVYNRDITQLLQIIDKQITDEVEVIVIDDNSDKEYKFDYKWLKYIRLEENSGGASVPRNKGLDIARGKYICFIDSDDIITNDYIETILNKIKTSDFDYCYISWKGYANIIINNEPPKWNCCVWNCIYKRELIGSERFNPIYKMEEDLDFNKRVRKGKRDNITKILYLYNIHSKDSLTKRGELYNDKYKH